MMFHRPLISLAWLNVGLHVAALALAGLAIRRGTPLVPVAERVSYLAQAPVGWALAWACWMFGAMALIAFLAVLAFHLRERIPWVSVALMLAVTGAGFDLFCDSIYILVFPQLAAAQQGTLFLAVERIVGIGSLVIANGSYSVAILLYNLADLRVGSSSAGPRERRTPFLAKAAGYLVGGFGLLLAAAAFTGVPWHAEWMAPPTIVFFCAWAVLIAYSVDSQAPLSPAI